MPISKMLIILVLISSCGYGSAMHDNKASGVDTGSEFVQAVTEDENTLLVEGSLLILQDCNWLSIAKVFLENGETEKALLALCNISDIAEASVHRILGAEDGELDLRTSPPPEGTPVLIITESDIFFSLESLGTASIATSYETPFDFDWELVEEDLIELRSSYLSDLSEDSEGDVVILAVLEIPEECLYKAIGTCYGAGFSYPRLETTIPSFVVED